VTLSLVLVATWCSAARAQQSFDLGAPAPTQQPRFLTRGLAEAGVGMLALPAAKLCSDAADRCLRGDSSLLLEAWTLVRPDPRYALGAGLGLGTNASDTALANSNDTVARKHGHRYFTAEFTGRWIPVEWGSIEPWLAGFAGLVVVSDSFASTTTTPTSGAAFLGPSASTLTTEGLSVGVGAGAAYRLSKRWALAAALRTNVWVLPSTPARNPLGDETSLRGANFAYSLLGALRYEVTLL